MTDLLDVMARLLGGFALQDELVQQGGHHVQQGAQAQLHGPLWGSFSQHLGITHDIASCAGSTTDHGAALRHARELYPKQGWDMQHCSTGSPLQVVCMLM